MAKVIFEFTENDDLSIDRIEYISVSVNISVSLIELNNRQPGHSECLAFIMKQNSAQIISLINELYIMKLKESGIFEINTECIKINKQTGDKNIH